MEWRVYHILFIIQLVSLKLNEFRFNCITLISKVLCKSQFMKLLYDRLWPTQFFVCYGVLNDPTTKRWLNMSLKYYNEVVYNQPVWASILGGLFGNVKFKITPMFPKMSSIKTLYKWFNTKLQVLHF